MKRAGDILGEENLETKRPRSGEVDDMDVIDITETFSTPDHSHDQSPPPPQLPDHSPPPPQLPDHSPPPELSPLEILETLSSSQLRIICSVYRIYKKEDTNRELLLKRVKDYVNEHPELL
jgi:hypothetical protein